MRRFKNNMLGHLPSEEKANVLTHGLGVLACLFAIPFLLIWGSEHGEWFHVLGLLLFSFSMLAVYLSSTIYHIVGHDHLKRRMRIIDHICIYFLIAGTHTPLLLYYFNNFTGYVYLGVLWGLVIAGIIYKLFFLEKWEWFSLALYLGMGWMAALTIPSMSAHMSTACLVWVLVGGASYTLGVIFYRWESLRFNHAIWHLFVLGGSTGHFIAIWQAAMVGG